jgi:zinc protease
MKKMFVLFILPLALLLTGYPLSCLAQNQELTKPIPMDSSVRMGKLPNGMTYYIKKNSKPEKRAELRLVVNAGSILENDDQQGLAHFNEHMAFNGTKNFQKNDIINFLELSGVKFGADLNAYTSFDETVYMMQLPTDSGNVFEKGFQILEDWAHNLSFDSIEVDKERGVVISERRLGLGAFQRMQAQYWPILFKDSRYAIRIPIGKLDILENCKHSTLKQFYKDWYRPDLMAVVVIGDVDVDKVEKMIKEKFSAIPSKPNPRPRELCSVPDNKGLLIAKATDKEDPYNIIELLYKHAKQHSTTLADMRRDMISELFSGMFNARMQELQKKAEPPFLFSFVNIGSLVRTKDAFTAYAYVKSMGIEKGIEALVTECERVKRFGFTATELERQKKELMSKMEQLLKEQDKTESKDYISDYVDGYLNNEPVPSVNFTYAFFKKYMAGVTLDDVNHVAKEWITNNGENAIIVLQSPSKDSASMPTDEAIRQIFESVQKKELKPYDDKVSDQPLMANKPAPGKVTGEKEYKELGITEWTLSNGVKVVMKPTDFKNDEIVFSAFRWGGTSLYPDKDYMSASFAAGIADEAGIGQFNSTALEKMLAGKIVSVSPTISELSEGFTGNCAPADMETAFQLMNLYFTNPRKDDTAFMAFMGQQKGFVENRSVDPGTAFNDTVGVTISGYNFRHRPFTTSTINEIDENRAFEIYKETFADAGGFTFFFVGNFKLSDMKPFVEMYLGSLPSKNTNPMWKDVGVTTPKGLINKTVYRGKEPKATVQLIYSGPFEYNRKNRLDMYILSSLLSIKLREQLREEMSGVYGVGAFGNGTHYPKQEYKFIIYFGCAPERVEELITAANKEIDSVKNFGAGPINLQKIKETMKRQHEVDMKDNKYWLSTLSQYYQNNENLMDILAFNNYVEAITNDDFKRLANMYLNMTNYAKFVLMPEK